MKKFLILVALLASANLWAGTLTGSIQTASAGTVNRGTLTFHLSQPGVVSGTASIVTSQFSCYTSAQGNVVAVPDPGNPVALSSNYSTGTLSAATYYVKYSYLNGTGESIGSSEAVFTMTLVGSLVVSAPSIQPSASTGYKVYIGTAPGQEKYQATVTGWSPYTQSVPLSSGAAPLSSNTSVCTFYFSDQIVPSGTYYTVDLRMPAAGTEVSGFPQTWCTFGGAAGTINVSNGGPTGSCGNNGVFYPTPILAVPPSNTQQSISGPLDVLMGVGLGDFTVGQLPQAAFDGQTVTVTDGMGSTPCQTGGGSPVRILCQWDVGLSEWVLVSGTGSSGSGCSTASLGLYDIVSNSPRLLRCRSQPFDRLTCDTV